MAALDKVREAFANPPPPAPAPPLDPPGHGHGHGNGNGNGNGFLSRLGSSGPRGRSVSPARTLLFAATSGSVPRPAAWLSALVDGGSLGPRSPSLTGPDLFSDNGERAYRTLVDARSPRRKAAHEGEGGGEGGSEGGGGGGGWGKQPGEGDRFAPQPGDPGKHSGDPLGGKHLETAPSPAPALVEMDRLEEALQRSEVARAADRQALERLRAVLQTNTTSSGGGGSSSSGGGRSGGGGSYPEEEKNGSDIRWERLDVAARAAPLAQPPPSLHTQPHRRPSEEREPFGSQPWGGFSDGNDRGSFVKLWLDTGGARSSTDAAGRHFRADVNAGRGDGAGDDYPSESVRGRAARIEGAHRRSSSPATNRN
jgi:hypothetical protein